MRIEYGDSIINKIKTVVENAPQRPKFIYLDWDEWSDLVKETDSYPSVRTINLPMFWGGVLHTIAIKEEPYVEKDEEESNDSCATSERRERV